MKEKQKAFQIEATDNVATALMPLEPGVVHLLGDTAKEELHIYEQIMTGHKVALYDMKNGEEIIKYGVPIGLATKDIKQGTWVHLHCMCSAYDKRSSHLDVITGAPMDIKYE